MRHFLLSAIIAAPAELSKSAVTNRARLVIQSLSTLRRGVPPLLALALAAVLMFPFAPSLSQAQPDTCRKSVRLVEIEVLDGQGVGEGQLELSVRGEVLPDGASGITSRNKYSEDQTRRPGQEIGVLHVPRQPATYEQTLKTTITHHEIGSDVLAGGDNRGVSETDLTIDCIRSRSTKRTPRAAAPATSTARLSASWPFPAPTEARPPARPKGRSLVKATV